MAYTQNVKVIHTKCHELLAKILSDERRKRGISQVELAKNLREQQNFISRLENGQRTIKVCELLILAKHIGFSPVAVVRQLAKACNSPKSVAAAKRRIRRTSR